ncbi:hypothetical protein SCMU_40550 [Sinomonas cyclohexanicum]|uniref:Uncharacterized protein n=1 Tax=Sinomonas cyclohexanicum TaxID=322009 RepID=A0ABN6FN03_SINCY|nr:hypothetical protein [Corynebacterium cyclohexanicum]BCT78213.1 hypothetical protein SCMU_40550 [Corynebacterium cyclohexanicum]
MSIQWDAETRSGAEVPRDNEEERIVAWRARLLRDAGFPATLAARMAAARGVDIHELLSLVDKGCPPELAVRIAGPLDLGHEG